MRNDPDILERARAGYLGEMNSSIWSSPVWIAHQAGAALVRHGRPAPVRAHMSRGYSAKVQTADGSTYLVALSGDDLETATVTHLA